MLLKLQIYYFRKLFNASNFSILIEALIQCVCQQIYLKIKCRGYTMEREISAKITAVTRDLHMHPLVFGESQNGIFRARIRRNPISRACH